MQSRSILENCWEWQFVSFHACNLSTLHGCIRGTLRLTYFLTERQGVPTACAGHTSPFGSIFPSSGVDVCFFVLLKGVHHVTLSHAPPPAFWISDPMGEGSGGLQKRGACRPSLGHFGRRPTGSGGLTPTIKAHGALSLLFGSRPYSIY